MNKYITEFIGTYFLVLTIGLTVVPGAGDLVTPLAIGAVLAAMIYAGGHISNAHYNPAITIAFWIRGRCETKDIAPYFIAQLIAASAAAATTSFLVGTGTPIPIKDVPSAFVA